MSIELRSDFWLLAPRLCPVNNLQNDCHSLAEPAPVQTGAGAQPCPREGGDPDIK